MQKVDGRLFKILIETKRQDGTVSFQERVQAISFHSVSEVVPTDDPSRCVLGILGKYYMCGEPFATVVEEVYGLKEPKKGKSNVIGISGSKRKSRTKK